MKNYNSFVRENEVLKGHIPSMRFESGNFSEWQSEAHKKLWSLLGLDKMERCANEFEVISDTVKNGCREIKFTFQSEKNQYIPCRMLIPNGVDMPVKPVICIQGHTTGMHISLGEIKFDGDGDFITGGDRDFAVRAANEGYAAIAMEQRCMGECGGTADGPSCYQTAMTALLSGRCLIGERVWDVMRLIDVLCENFEFLDTENIMCLGNSGGGTTTFYAACIDTRIKTAVPSCAVCTYKDSIGSLYHCACNYIPSIAEYFDMGDLGGLIAPRRLIVVNGKDDDIFPQNGVIESYEIIQRAYDAAGVPDNCCLVTGNEGHRFYADDAWNAIKCGK